VTVLSSSGRIPGIDVRGPGRRTGGYLVGAGSLTALVGGHRYRLARDRPILPLPPWLITVLTPPKR
jgi:hypothetical protein